jgi:hypothetical protein
MDDLCKDLGNNISSPPTHSSSLKTIGVNPNARERRHFINLVLKSIENLDQWNHVKEAKEDDIMLAGSNVKKFNARDRKHHVNPVFNPVENIAQWKLAKAKRVTFVVEMFEVEQV